VRGHTGDQRMVREVKKTLLVAAAAALAPMFVTVTPRAGAAPCNVPMTHMTPECSSCYSAAGVDVNAQRACLGYAPVNQNPQSQWADCNALQLPSDRAQCVDQHIAGQR
jgi:hypothetical protein